ncbi:TniB family NTP-binding protein [Uliginosibacterium sediminicola]
MEGLLNRARRSKSPGGLWILGHGGQGKSFLLDAFSRRHPPVDTTKWRQCEVMLIPLRSRPSKSDILLTIMLILGINPGMLKYQNNSDLEKIVVDAMSHCGVRVILFDESQHLWLSTTGKINRSADRLGGEVGDFLKELYDKTGIAFVFAGTPGLEVVVNSDSQANTRWAGVLHLKPFENDAKFSALLEALDDSLPMEERSNLAEPELLSMIHQATQGNFRRLKNLLAEAVFLAASAEERRVRKQHLADAFFEISCAEATPFGHAS